MRRIGLRALFILVSFAGTMFMPNFARAQNSDTGLPEGQSVKAPAAQDNPSPDSQTADKPSPHSHSAADYPDSASRREVTWRSLPKDFLRDQKDIWLFPTQLAKGNHWDDRMASGTGRQGALCPILMPSPA